MREEDPVKFFNHLRMTPTMFDHLLDKLKDNITKKYCYREPISAGLRLAMTLRYLASGDIMKSIARQFRVGESTVSQVIRETCSVIWEILQSKVFPQKSKENWKQMAKDFENKWQFPNCIGAIDGKHVIIQCPPNAGSTYFNYKDCHSVVLLAVCDANYCFILVDIGSEGRNSDGGIFRQSKLGKLFINNEMNVPSPSCISNQRPAVPYVLVADAAFTMTNFLMKPFSGKRELRRDEKVFNYRLSRARRCIENAFGILSARWRIFRRPINCSLRTIDNIIKATVCLHNYIMQNEKNTNTTKYYCPPNFVDRELPNGVILLGEWRQYPKSQNLQKSVKVGTNTYSKNASEIRNIFKDYFVNEGAVEFQWDRLNNF